MPFRSGLTSAHHAGKNGQEFRETVVVCFYPVWRGEPAENAQITGDHQPPTGRTNPALLVLDQDLPQLLPKRTPQLLLQKKLRQLFVAGNAQNPGEAIEPPSVPLMELANAPEHPLCRGRRFGRQVLECLCRLSELFGVRPGLRSRSAALALDDLQEPPYQLTGCLVSFHRCALLPTLLPCHRTAPPGQRPSRKKESPARSHRGFG